MVAPPRRPYPVEPGLIGRTPEGTAVTLAAMTPAAAKALGAGLAAIDPWARANISAERMANFLASHEDTAPRYQILTNGEPAGVIVVRHPWLHGPYLHLLGLLLGFQGRGIGDIVLGWFEREAHGNYRNIWLCVSSFNVNAQRFYEAHGFQHAACLESLVFDGADELLMRKRLE